VKFLDSVIAKYTPRVRPVAPKGQTKVESRHGKGLEDVYPDLDKEIKALVADGFDDISSTHELYGGNEEPESIEHKSRSGFISSNDGGYRQTAFTTIGNIENSGNGHLPKKAAKAISKQFEENCKYALEDFKEQYADKLKDIPETKLHYAGLYDLGHGDLAEALSELEREHNEDDHSSVMFELLVMFHNEGKDDLSFTVQGAVNWEAPYHRSKGAFEDYYQATIEFTEKDIPQIAKKVKAEIDKAVSYLGA
jgi:hypothetical protein